MRSIWLPAKIKVGVVNVFVAGCKIDLFDKGNYESSATNGPGWMKGSIKIL